MADEEKKKKILDSSFKGDDRNQKKPPTTTTEAPVEDIPAKEKKTAVKGGLSKLLNSSSSHETVSPVDDIQAKIQIPAPESEVLILDPNSPLPLNLNFTDEAKRDVLRQMNDNKVKVNEKPMLEMEDIPAKVKMAAEAKSKTTPDHRFPLKTDYPRSYGGVHLSETVVSESPLKPTIGEASSGKAGRNGDDDGSTSSDDESGNVSAGSDN